MAARPVGTVLRTVIWLDGSSAVWAQGSGTWGKQTLNSHHDIMYLLRERYFGN